MLPWNFYIRRCTIRLHLYIFYTRKGCQSIYKPCENTIQSTNFIFGAAFFKRGLGALWVECVVVESGNLEQAMQKYKFSKNNKKFGGCFYR